MDTTYYTLNVRRVKVSGGADLISFVPVSAPAPAEGTGAVLDFARCRQRLETKAAWKGLVEAAREELPEESFSQENVEAQPVSSRQEKVRGWLELAATVAMIAVSLAAVVAFLR